MTCLLVWLTGFSAVNGNGCGKKWAGSYLPDFIVFSDGIAL
jgi:hypothetical protein